MKRASVHSRGRRWRSACRSPLLAQDEPYPSRPVRLIAAAGPGGNPDVLARLLARQALRRHWARPFVVENVPGAGGVVAANLVAKAPPDGHVLMLGDSGALAINAALNPSLTYHPIKDFTPITALATVPTVFLAQPVGAGEHARGVRRARQEGARAR